jgi:hypothetical protein
MRKTAEAEHQLKLAIRDIVAGNPLVSVAALQRDLAERGFKTNQGNTLDWYYVAKVVRKLNHEKCPRPGRRIRRLHLIRPDLKH